MTEPRMTGTKTCSKCLKDLPVIFFPVNKTSKDGLSPDCRECTCKRLDKTRNHLGIRKASGSSINNIPGHLLKIKE